VSIKSTIISNFPERVRIWRENAHLSQEQLAVKLGISRNYVHLIEANKKNPGPKLIERFTELESGKLTTEIKEESPPYRATFNLEVLSDADVQRLFDAQVAELKTCDPGRKKLLLESIRALAHEMECRL
jgi:transcriptional regulator with XRE-family HTH domain